MWWRATGRPGTWAGGVEAIEPADRPLARVQSHQVDLDAAFAALRPRLLRIARSLVGPEAGEDAVQDTYLVARRSIGQLREPAAIDGWLTRICVHRCFRVRRRGRHLERLVPWLSPPRPLPTAADMELVDLVSALPPHERSVIVLHHGHGYSLAEVATLVGVSHDNARAIASRARRKLRRAWQEGEA